MSAPKRERKQLAKASLLMSVAMTAQRWADQIAGTGDTRPFSEWPDDDPLVQLCKTFDLTADEVAGIATTIAAELENRAIRAGYDAARDYEDAPSA